MDCGSPLLLLTCVLLMTSSHSEGPGLCVARVPRNGRNFEYGQIRNINTLHLPNASVTAVVMRAYSSFVCIAEQVAQDVTRCLVWRVQRFRLCRLAVRGSWFVLTRLSRCQ